MPNPYMNDQEMKLLDKTMFTSQGNTYWDKTVWQSKQAANMLWLTLSVPATCVYASVCSIIVGAFAAVTLAVNVVIRTLSLPFLLIASGFQGLGSLFRNAEEIAAEEDLGTPEAATA